MSQIQNATTIAELLDRNQQALNAKDIEGVLANQHPDARLEVSRQFTIEGPDPLAAYTQALWARSGSVFPS